MTKQQALEKLWAMGHTCEFLLDGNQKEVVKSYYENPEQKQAFVLNRQGGKSFCMLALADQECRRTPNYVVTYVAATQKQAKKITKTAMREIFATCPPHLKPEYKTQEGIFRYPNGSEIEILGNNAGRIEDARGPKSHLIICDEIGFWTDMDYAIKSVLSPRLNTTKGKLLMISTPPRSAAHPFYTLVKECERNGSLIIRNIFDCPRYTERDVEKFAKECGGYDSNEFRREYCCEFLTDTDHVVFPEATEELIASITGISVRPAYFDAYVSCDWGSRDKTVMLFAYWDFRQAKLFIEDEILLKNNETRSDIIADCIFKKEAELWQGTNPEKFTPYNRISDLDLRLLNDLNSIHDLTIMPTLKDNKEAAINEVRMMLKNCQIIVSPKCKKLLFDLQNTTWNKNRTSYERSKEHGHGDACFLPGSTVITSIGIKNIEDILPGDLVLTHKGNFKQVNHLLSRTYTGEILDLKIAGTETIKCTPDHKFRTALAKKTQDLEKALTGQKTISEESWLEAKNLIGAASGSENTVVLKPLINKIDNEIKLSKEMCFLYGYFVAEGSLGGNKSQVQFAGHVKEINVVAILKEALVKEYGYEKQTFSRRTLRRRIAGTHKPVLTKLQYTPTPGELGRRINLSNSKLWRDLRPLGKLNEKKFPEFITQLNDQQAFYMLCGYLFGDGHFSKVGIKATTISKQIAYGLHILGSILGITPNLKRGKSAGVGKINGRIIYTKKTTDISFNKTQSIAVIDRILNTPDLSFVFDDKLIHDISLKIEHQIPYHYKKVKAFKSSFYNGPVYTLEVEDDHSYTINGVAVKNCDALIYLVRNLNKQHNPYPPGYELNLTSNSFVSQHYKPENTELRDGIKKMFTPKSTMKRAR